ncbi:MAG: M24 family metallopeptidase, partial [Sedimentisphaerales bacterium]|nr:M24 family metallopeptidase [Sedimentisphaerales bacterium]
LEYRMMLNGAEGPGFPTIIAFGGHASECHAQPGTLKLKKGQPFLIDWGAKYNGYTSDITRCHCLGKLPVAVEDAYKLLLEAQLAAIDSIAPGVPMNVPDQVARKILEKHPDAYSHGTGHGIGLNVHEKPFLGTKSTDEFKEGMIVTVEPGIYPANKFGLRIEDDVLVTAKGHSVLTASVPKSLEAVSIY